MNEQNRTNLLKSKTNNLLKLEEQRINKLANEVHILSKQAEEQITQINQLEKNYDAALLRVSESFEKRLFQKDDEIIRLKSVINSLQSKIKSLRLSVALMMIFCVISFVILILQIIKL